MKGKAKAMPKARLTNLRIDELSGVDKPCVAPATVAIMKRSNTENDMDDDDDVDQAALDDGENVSTRNEPGDAFDDEHDTDGNENRVVRCAKCSQYMEKGLQQCPSCGGPPMMGKKSALPAGFLERREQVVCTKIGKRAPSQYDPDNRSALCKAVWSTADVDDLPDSSFLYIEGGGKKDEDGKTVPRSLRHFPYKNAGGDIDIPHLRDAIGRIPQSSLPASVKEKLQQKAEKLLAAQHDKNDSSKRNSTRKTSRPHAGDREDSTMSEAEIADLKKRLARAEAVNKMSPEHRAHHASLKDDKDGDAFIAKSSADRDAAIKAELDADPVVYKTDDGVEIRKSHGNVAVILAKKADESTKLLKAQGEQLAAAQAIAKRVELAKKAREDFGFFGGTEDERIALAGAVASIADEKTRTAVATMLKGQNAVAESFTKFSGANTEPGAIDARESFDTALATFAKAKGKTVEAATADFLRTPEGNDLYQATKPQPKN